MGAPRRASVQWSRAEAMELISAIKGSLPETLHLGLTGSLLTEATGNDLDIIIYPSDSSMPRDEMIDAMDPVLGSQGFICRHFADDVQAHWATKGSTDLKTVEIWFRAGKKLDVFYLR